VCRPGNGVERGGSDLCDRVDCSGSPEVERPEIGGYNGRVVAG